MKLTKQSLRNLMWTVQTTKAHFGSMLTLTYPALFPASGVEVKSDLNVMLNKVRRKGWKYLWFFEFQERGAPHIHILLTANAVSPHLRVTFGLDWVERVATSPRFRSECPEDRYVSEVLKMVKVNLHRRTFELLREVDSARNYVMKYASKEKQKEVPENFLDVGRFWGCSKKVQPKPLRTVDVTEEELRDFLLSKHHEAGKYPVLPRMLWGVEERGAQLTISE